MLRLSKRAAFFLAVIHSFTSNNVVIAADDAINPAGVHANANAPTITLAPPTPTTVEKRDACQPAGQPGTPILSTLHYAFTALPQQVYPFPVLRGPQTGFNVCNSTTDGPNSMCQTLIFNGPDDFCLWGSPTNGSTIGQVEADVVSYCTKPGHGGRVFPPGAITGLQWVRTNSYIQVVGFVDNSLVGLTSDDGGGELDPHGCDLQGNPLGGVVYSNATGFTQDGHTMEQVFNWNQFIGSGQFCFKACFNNVTSPDFCENRFDTIGCAYNMPSAAQNNVFEMCDSDLQDPAGTYTTNGQTLTIQPGDNNPPYQPRIPASRNCQTFQASDLFPVANPSQSGSGNSASPGSPGQTGAPGQAGSGGQNSSQPGGAFGSIRMVSLTGDLGVFLGIAVSMALVGFSVVMV